MLVVEDALYRNNIGRISAGVAHGRHDCRKHMLLDRERSGVEFHAENLIVGDEAGPCATEGEDQQLGDDLNAPCSVRRIYSGIWSTYTADGDRGIAEEEKLVQAGDDNGPNKTEHPGADGRDWDIGVIRVRNSGTDLWVRRVVLCQNNSVN